MLQVPCLGAVPRHLSSTSDRKGHLLPLSSHSLTLGPQCASPADTALRLFFTHRPHGEVGSQVCCAGLSVQKHVREGQGGVVHRGAGTADPERWAPQTPRGGHRRPRERVRAGASRLLGAEEEPRPWQGVAVPAVGVWGQLGGLVPIPLYSEDLVRGQGVSGNVGVGNCLVCDL